MEKNWRGWLVVGLLWTTTLYALAEELSLTTYYPSPKGAYQTLSSTDSSRFATYAGNVGIGTISPAATTKLEVKGAGNTSGSAGLHVTNSDGTSGLFVRDDGYVGIGTASPNAKLDVNGNVRIADGTQGTGKVLTSDVNGVASWQSGIPSGTLMYFNLSSCPSGWSEFTTARGRYLVAGGTLGTTVGTALSNGEDRPVGQHSHSATQGTHHHSVPDRPTGGPANNGVASDGIVGSFNIQTTDNSAGPITIGNAGTTPGTNAPYLQVLLCQKN